MLFEFLILEGGTEDTFDHHHPALGSGIKGNGGTLDSFLCYIPLR